MKYPVKVGLFGIGLDTYWPQFKGLKPRLEGYVRAVEKKLVRPGVEVVNLGLIDNPVKALEAGHYGPSHIKIAESKTKVRLLKAYHGKVGRWLSVEISVKHSPVTINHAGRKLKYDLNKSTVSGDTAAQ